MPPNRKLLWIISFHHACNDGTLMALVALIPVLAVQMDLSYYDVGLLGFGLIITVVVQYLVGRFADRVFSRYLLEVGALLMGASFVLLLFVSNFEELFLAVIVMRVGGAFYHPVGTSWITREFSGDYLETAIGVQSGVGNFGVIIALATSGFLGEMFSWKAPCLLWAGLNSAAVILGLFAVEASTITTRIEKVRATIAPKITLRKMLYLILPIATGGALYQVTSYFGPINLTRSPVWDAGTADVIFAIWIGVGTVTSYSFGKLSARYGKYQLLKAGYLISTVASIVLALTLEWFFVAPALIVFGAFLFVTYPALFSMVTDVTGEAERGTAFGILFGFQLGGGAATVYICGIIADAMHSPIYSFIIAAGLALASFIAVSAYAREAKTMGAPSPLQPPAPPWA